MIAELATAISLHPEWSNVEIATAALGPNTSGEIAERVSHNVAIMRLLVVGATPLAFPSHDELVRFCNWAAAHNRLNGVPEYYVNRGVRTWHRIDLAVFADEARKHALWAVECKNKTVEGSARRKALAQAKRYGDALGCTAVLVFPRAERITVDDVDVMSPTHFHLMLRRYASERAIVA